MKHPFWLCLTASLLAFSAGAAAPPPPVDTSPPRIALIIDDIGDNLRNGLRAVRLPGAVTCAFLPHTAYSRQLALSAHTHNKEVMLHLPMASKDGRPPGPGALTLNMTRAAFLRTFQADLASLPYVSGVNNHMGSLITRHPGHMTWLMHAIRRHGGLYFVDSRTTEATVAQRVAQETGIPNLSRDVFLDNVQRPKAIARQFARLLTLARQRGSAVAIGHPHPVTLHFLEQRLPQLRGEGIQLVPVSRLIRPEQRPTILFAAKSPERAPVVNIP